MKLESSGVVDQRQFGFSRGSDGNYKNKWHTAYGTRDQAEHRLAELVLDLRRGKYIERSGLTLGQWFQTWLEKAVKPQKARNTFTSYDHALETHIKPKLGHIRLQQLKPLDLEQYYAESGLGANTKRQHHAIITRALKSAVNAGLLRSNPASRVEQAARSEEGGHSQERVDRGRGAEVPQGRKGE